MPDRGSALARLKERARSTFAQNLFALYSVHALNYVIPLVTVPFLTRVLLPSGWGGVAYAQSLAAIVVIVAEYGFTLSAGRDVSINRNDPQWLATKLSSVTTAKAVLLLSAIGIAVGIARFVPFLHDHPKLFYAGMLWAVAQGMSPLWFYQGLERMRLSSTVDVCFKLAGICLIFALVRQPTQGALVLAIYAGASIGSSAFLYALAQGEFGFGRTSIRAVAAELRSGLALFFFQASVGLYTAANTFILGFFVPVPIVGIYAGAERISKSAVGLLGPMNQALYPRMNKALHSDPATARAIVRRVFWMVAGVTTAAALALVGVAPLVVRILLGSKFADSVPALRILAFLIPVIGASNVLGIHWMLPLRRDRAFSVIVALAGVVNIVMACILAPRLQANGMAIAVLSAESGVTIACFVYLSFVKRNPLYDAAPQETGMLPSE